MAKKQGNKVAMKAKSPKKTRQGNGKHSKFPGKGSSKETVSKSYRKKYRGQGK
jgi:hypothetical protein